MGKHSSRLNLMERPCGEIGVEMSLNTQAIINTFHLNMPDLQLRNLASPRIAVEVIEASRKWSPVFIWQMTVAEMVTLGVAGQTVCFHIMLDSSGLPMSADVLRAGRMAVRYGFDNQASKAQFEKVWPEPPTNFTMGMGGKYWTEICGPNVQSDRVVDITLQNPADMEDPNGHHVAVIAWQFQAGNVVTKPIPPAQGYSLVRQGDIDTMLGRLDVQLNELRAMRQEVASWRR